MTIELIARHRDTEGNAVWEAAEECQCCGKLVIDVWAVYGALDGKSYNAVGRECMKKVAGFVHPSDYKKAEADFCKAQRKQKHDKMLNDAICRGQEASDDKLVSIIRAKVRESLQQSWIDELSNPIIRANIILMGA